MTVELLNIDCMKYMAGCDDNAFDLAIVDPPYGIGENAHRSSSRSKLCNTTEWGAFDKEWDRACPEQDYFDALFRVSKNQIIWGANHMMHRISLPSPCWLVWDKDNSGCFADCELAWSSFGSAVRRFRFRWNGMIQADMKKKELRIHPTQKPVKLYDWILSNYAKEGDSILDTHLGSASSAIAAYYGGFDFVGCELDKSYFDASVERFSRETAQRALL